MHLPICPKLQNSISFGPFSTGNEKEIMGTCFSGNDFVDCLELQQSTKTSPPDSLAFSTCQSLYIAVVYQ